MAKYKTSFCPYCKFPLQIHKMYFEEYKSPFQECPRCHKVFIDKDAIELGLEYYPLKRVKKILPASIIIGIIGILLLIVGSGDKGAFTRGCMIIAFSAFTIYKSLSTYNERLAEMETLLRESEERLKNKQYLLALHRYGYHIPKKYYHIIENEIESNSAHN